MKQDIRAKALKHRDSVAPEAQVALARRLADLGPGLVFEADPSRRMTSLYAQIGSEPDPMPLAEALHSAGIGLALPVDWSSGLPLLYRRWTPGDRLAPGPLRIREPLESAAVCEPDILFVPAVAFDRLGNRIGYGAGNVDRTVAALRARKQVRVIGVAFAIQEEPLIPIDPHDEPMDQIITEHEIIDCRR